MRAALYGRVSTSDQNLALQIRELRAYVEHQGWDTAEVYQDVMSVAKTSRPPLNRRLDPSRFQDNWRRSRRRGPISNPGDAATKDAQTTGGLARKVGGGGSGSGHESPERGSGAGGNQHPEAASDRPTETRPKRRRKSLPGEPGAGADCAGKGRCRRGARQPEPDLDRSGDRRRGGSAQCGRGPDLVSVLKAAAINCSEAS